MELSAFLLILLYIAAIVLMVVFIIVGIRLINILDKVDRIVDDIGNKVSSFDHAVSVMSKTTNDISNISN